VSQVVTTPPDVEAQSAEVSAEPAESAQVQSELTPTSEPRKKRRKVDEDDASLLPQPSASVCRSFMYRTEL